MKKLFAFALMLILIICTVLPAGAAFDSGVVTSELDSKIYYMQSLDENTVFFEKNAEKKTAAAAFVKLIAAVTAIEKWKNLDEYVTVTKENLSLVTYTYGVRTASYKAGEKVTKRELIDCLIIYSANDAASIIAYEISGSLEGFIKEMQITAEKMGCTSTAIKNIHGFDEEGQYTTAKDVASIIKYAMNYPVFVEAFSASSLTLKKTELNEERVVNASNKMKNSSIPDYYHSSVTGGKQTSTTEAGECIAVISSLDGYSYLTIVMGGSLKNVDSDPIDENTCMTDARKMLRWVYKNIKYRVVVAENQVVSVVDVMAGKGTDKVNLISENETYALVPSNATIDSVLIEVVEGTVPEKLKAPVKAGDQIGQAKVYYAGTVLATVNLVASEDVKLSFFGMVITGLKNVMSSKIFIIILVAGILFCIGYVAYLYYNYRKQEKQKQMLQAKLEKRRQQMRDTMKK